MDHAAIFGPGKGLKSVGDTIRQVVSGGADAVMTSYGVSRRFSKELAPVGLILRADGAATRIGPDRFAPLFFGVEEALRLGADGLCVSAYPGSDREVESLESLAIIAREAHQWGLAVMAEMVPGGMNGGPELRTLENVALAARLGQELGGDWSKVPYVDGFDEVVSSCYLPVVIMGGSKRSELEMLVELKAAMENGAAGGTIGRNIFESDDPEAMTAALVAIVHDDASVEEAHDILLRKRPFKARH